MKAPEDVFGVGVSREDDALLMLKLTEGARNMICTILTVPKTRCWTIRRWHCCGIDPSVSTLRTTTAASLMRMKLFHSILVGCVVIILARRRCL